MTREPDLAAGRSQALLEARNLEVRYRGGAVGIQDVSLEMHPGEVVTILGPNGAGKTTTVRAVSGFLRTEGARVTRGSIVCAGRKTTNLEPHQLAHLGVAFVPERRKVFSALSVLDNLMSIGSLPKQPRRSELLDRVFEMFPMLAGRRSEAAGRLSGGQQQMLAIGRSLMLEPRILIVDEITLGLHVSLHPPLFDAMRKIADTGAAIAIVDENAGQVLHIADRCMILRAGRVVAEGPASQFREADVVAASYTDAV